MGLDIIQIQFDSGTADFWKDRGAASCPSLQADLADIFPNTVSALMKQN